jgi:hypothetical protein
MSKNKEVLKKIGLSDDLIEQLTSTDAAVLEKIDVDAASKSIRDVYVKAFESDGTFDEQKKNERATILKIRDKKLIDDFKAIGVEFSDEEYKALPADKTSDHLAKELAKRAEAKMKSGSGNPDDKDKEITRLNAEISNYVAEVKKLKEEELPKYQTEAQKQIEEFKKEQKIRSEFSKLNAGKLVADEEILYPGFKQKLQDKYDLRTDGDSIVIYEKGKDIKVMKDNKPLSFTSAVDDLSADLRKKQEDPKTRKVVEGEEGKEMTTVGASAYQKKMAEKEAELKKP